MHRDQGLTNSRNPGNGERFLFSLALILVGALWIAKGLAVWAAVLCVAAMIGGTAGALFFGARFVSAKRRAS